MDDKSYSRILAEFTAGLTYEHIPERVVARVKDHMLDTVGCMLAGSTASWTKMAIEVAKRLGGPPEATIVGDGGRVAVANAVLANGAGARALDLDDSYFRAFEHVSAFIVPTALAVGEWLGKGGREVITAAVAGYEVGCRIGLARLRDRAFLHDQSLGAIENKPIYPTGALFACSVISAKLMGLSVAQTTSAMGFVGSMGLFLMQTHREKAQAMPFNNGWACYAGLISAMTAQTGLRGPERIFEGDRGYFEAFGAYDPYQAERLIENLGTMWESGEGTIKFYPAAHPTHYFISSTKCLRDQGLRPEDVEEIVCYVPRTRAEFHFSPREKAYRPEPYDARFSIPYLMAVMLVDGQLGVGSFTEAKLQDANVLAVAQRISCALDEDSWQPEDRGHIVVKTRDARTLEQKTPHSRLPGSPDNPVSRKEILNKFRDTAGLVLTADSIDKLIDAFGKLEDVGNVDEIVAMMIAEKDERK